MSIELPATSKNRRDMTESDVNTAAYLHTRNTVFLITTYPFTRHRSPYTPAVNKMPSSCTMAKEWDIFFLLNYTVTC